MRGRSYTLSPPRGYGRRERSPSPRGRYGGGSGSRGNSRDLPTSLLVRNLRHDCRNLDENCIFSSKPLNKPDDLRRPFGQFGALKDIYLPKDYYTGEPRGFGFIQYVDPADATEAKYHMDGQILHGRQVTVVFAEENRKKPTEMRARDRGSGCRYHVRRSPRYSRSQYSRSPPRYASSRSHERDYYSPPPKRTYSRSVSPRERSYSRHSQDRLYSRSPGHNGGSRSRSHSPVRGPSRSRSRSQSPNQKVSGSPNHYPWESNGDRSPTP